MNKLKSHQRKLVALRDLKIQVGSLEIREEEKQSLLSLIGEVIKSVANGAALKGFGTKIGFIATLIERMKKGI